MNISPSNSKLQTTFELPNTKDQDFYQEHFRKRDVLSTLLPEDLNHRAFSRYGNVDVQQNTFTSSTDQEILDPKKQDVEIVDPKRDIPDREFPEQEEDDEDQTPDQIVPEEDNHYLTDDEGDIIKVPSQELDTFYLGGHADMENTTSFKEEFPKSDPPKKKYQKPEMKLL